MLLRLETPIRERLERERVTLRVALWVAGGRTPEERARRFEIALYARARMRSRGWPDLWVFTFFADVDARSNRMRGARGLRPLGVQKTCAEATLPAAPPPARRRTAKRWEAAAGEGLTAMLVAIDAESLSRTSHRAEPDTLERIASWLRDAANYLDERARLRR